MNQEVIVVTGSAVGIGRALAESHTKRGSLVFGLDIVEQAPCQNLNTIKCNIGNSEEVAKVFEKISAQADHIDLLVNNAGLWNDTSLTGGDFEAQSMAFKSAIDSGLMGSFYCTLAALPLLTKSRAANIINMQTEHTVPGHYLTGLKATGYDCAKFSLWRLTATWALDLKKRGIRVNGLNFGATDTPMLRAVAPAVAEKGMKGEDIVLAVDNIVSQGPNGDSGQSYLFGTNGTTRAQSLIEISNLSQPTLSSQN